MRFEIDTSGIDKFRENMEAMAEPQSVPLTDLFPDEFMKQHTRFTSAQAMMDSGSVIETDGNGVDSPEWDAFVDQFTDFKSWQEMKDAALAEYAKRRLFEGM